MILHKMTRILLVGSGITSAVTGAILRKELPLAELVTWDKARKPGGRMSTYGTSRHPSTTDLGAQYISTTTNYDQIHRGYYEDIKTAGLLVPLTAKIKGLKTTKDEMTHYVTPQGVSSLVEHYLQKAKPDMKFEHHIETINSVGKRWEVISKDGIKDSFDIVVLTMPIPQILQLQGQIRRRIEDNPNLHNGLQSVEYSSRYALGLFYNQGSDVSLSDGNCAQYITDDPIIRFVSIDNLKRGREDESPSVVAHTSVPFGKANVEKTPGEVEDTLVTKIKELFPHWPKPEWVKCHKWRFSQVTSAFPGLPGAVEIDKGLIAGGDGFIHSNFDGCIESAEAIARLVSKHVANV